MDREKSSNGKQLMKMHDSQTLLLWSQIFTLEPRKVRESNMLSFYIKIKDGDVQTLERAYNKLIETNDSLRLRFCHVGVLKIRQYIDDFTYVHLPVRTMASQQEFADYLPQVNKTVLPMFGECLTRAELVKIADGSVALVMEFHHMIMDGYSIALIFSRIAEAYEQYRQGIEPDPKQYSILHSLSQLEQYKASVRHAEDRAFWKKGFRTQPHYSFPAGKRSHNGDCDAQEISIKEQLYQDTIKLAAELGCSVQCLVMSAAAFTVYKLTGKTNFCIYSLTHGRYDFLARKTIGCLMNTVPVFFNLDPRQNFRALIQEEYINFLETLKHARLGMSEQTPLSYREPVRHGFNFNHAWLIVSAMDYGAAFSKSDYEARMIAATNQPHQFYCTVLEIPGDRIDIKLRFQIKKYNAAQAMHFLKLFQEVIGEIAANPQAQLSIVREMTVPVGQTETCQ